jgi:hypothetical protein
LRARGESSGTRYRSEKECQEKKKKKKKERIVGIWQVSGGEKLLCIEKYEADRRQK